MPTVMPRSLGPQARSPPVARHKTPDAGRPASATTGSPGIAPETPNASCATAATGPAAEADPRFMTTIDAGLSPTTASCRIKIVVVRPRSNGRRKKTSYAINGLPGMTVLAARTARFLHLWSRGGELCMLAQLRGHQDAVTGAGLPSGSDVLFSGSQDGTVRSWDCGTGACVRVFQVGREVGSVVTEGSGVFVCRWSEKEKEKESLSS